MQFSSLTKLSSQISELLPPLAGSVAFVFCVDEKLVAETVEHHLNLEFDVIVVLGNDPRCVYDHAKVINVCAAIDSYQEVWPILQKLLPKLMGHWVYWGFNAEFFFYPFCENRTIKDLTIFLTEERRKNFFSIVIDSYNRELKLNSVGLTLEDTAFDAVNYFYTDPNPQDFPNADEEVLTRVKNVFGGLRWRYSEYLNKKNAKIDRVSLFMVHDKLEFNEYGKTEDPEFYSYKCPHHHNPTGAIISYRTAIDLMHNPRSRQSIADFEWMGSEKFGWNSPQLLRLGIIETGQWF